MSEVGARTLSKIALAKSDLPSRNTIAEISSGFMPAATSAAAAPARAPKIPMLSE